MIKFDLLVSTNKSGEIFWGASTEKKKEKMAHVQQKRRLVGFQTEKNIWMSYKLVLIFRVIFLYNLEFLYIHP